MKAKTTENKTDLKKELKVAFSAKRRPEIVDIPPMQYISFEGKGDPNNSPLFEKGMNVLYGLAYTLKFQLKKQGRDFVVAPLEGQWWGTHMEVFAESRKDEWLWKVMIAVPEFVTKSDFEAARRALTEQKDVPGLEEAVIETIHDGPSVQVLYYGPYAEEGPTIAAMHQYAFDLGYKLRSRHREVYMSDPRRTAPEKLKTIIRQPVERA